MADRLSLYNGALRLLGERRLASLEENREPRRLLDEAWQGGAIDYCLEAGQWRFATRSVEFSDSPSLEPYFGFSYAYPIPEDHVRTVGVFRDARMQTPNLDVRTEASTLYANISPLFFVYVSNDSEFGGSIGNWPQTFVKFVEAHLASEIAMGLSKGREVMDDMLTLRDKKFLPDALNKDSMEDTVRFMPRGAWVSARMAGSRYRRS